jgi:histidine triad (HIT) family protein
MSTNCIFCKIVSGEIPSQKVYSDDRVTAFRDIHPVSPTHILIVPNKHIASVNEVEPEDEGSLGHMLSVARKLAEEEKIDQTGYRLIINSGSHAGQEVFHLHMHLLGGQKMRYPMG